MLESLKLHNFKSARDLEVPLGNLTVLSGLNGSGKSSVLQAISLVRQSLLISQRVRLPSFHLRGPLVQLGVADDVLSDRATDGSIGIALSVDGLQTDWTANATVGSDILQIQFDADVPDPGELYLRNCHFQFLQADRLTPQTHYERSDSFSRDMGFLGAHGEFTPDYLAEHGDRLEVSQLRRCKRIVSGLPDGLMERIGATPKLYDQISGWMQYLSPGVQLKAGRLSQTDLVSLRFLSAWSLSTSDDRNFRSADSYSRG